MDDFINKVAFGSNLVFSNGVAYPKTSDLIVGGAKYEQQFKNFIRRHQLPTEVWYNAHPGLTAVDLTRNKQIRRGIERRHRPSARPRPGSPCCEARMTARPSNSATSKASFDTATAR